MEQKELDKEQVIEKSVYCTNIKYSLILGNTSKSGTY